MKELEKFNPLKTEITQFVAPILNVKVTDFKSSQQAIDAAKTLKEMSRRVDEIRREEVDPLNAKVKSVNDYAKQIKAPLDQAETHIRNELNAFAAQQEKIRQDELRKAEEERRRKEEELRQQQEAEKAAVDEGLALFGAGEEDAAEQSAAVEEKHAIEQAVQTSEFKQREYDINQFQLKNTRKTTKCRVVDMTKVPREFLIIEVNEKAAIAAHKAGVAIPGLEFYQEIGVAIGQKTRATKAALESSNG